MVSIEVEKAAPAAADGEEAAHPPLARVQGLVAADSATRPDPDAPSSPAPHEGGGNGGSSDGAHWSNATVVESEAGRVSLVYDDGTFEGAVPGYRVRAVPQPESKQRLNPLAAIFMSFEQFLSSREERRGADDPFARDSQPANLKRTLSAFHIGRAQQVGRVPREALDDDAAEPAAAPAAMDAAPTSSGAASMAHDPFDIAPMRLRVRFSLGTETDVPSDAGLCFEDDASLLYCMQLLRESTPSGKLASLAPQELGYHPGVTCDRSGQNPIVGNRYKLRDENYDVCKAEFERMPAEEQEEYTRIPPPVFRKAKGCGPAKWHLYYTIEVAEQRISAGGGARNDVIAASGAGAASAVSSAVGATRPEGMHREGSPRAGSPRASILSSPRANALGGSPRQGSPRSSSGGLMGSPSALGSGGGLSGGALSWSAKEVEAGL
uniref:Uncharacterized protein n=1 Tax=Haptolina brevifila TaxID=156173 RepID=A0A7S2GEM6_9EUKA